MSASFQHGLCGCFDNCCVCIVTYFCPCYTAGKVAEAVGESCILHGILTFVPVVGMICRAFNREKVRSQKNIPGGIVSDVCVHLFCAPCALCQEAQEVGALDSKMAQTMARE